MSETLRLSPYVIADLLARFGGGPGARVGDDIRFPLSRCTVPLLVAPADSPESARRVELFQISLKGVWIRSRQALAEGTVIRLALLEHGIAPQTWTCYIAEAQNDPAGDWSAYASIQMITPAGPPPA